MHEKTLAGINRDLDELKQRNPAAYKRLEAQLNVIAETSDLEVHKALRQKKKLRGMS